MIRVHLNGPTLAQIRLATSPMSEAVACLRLAANGQDHPVYGDPGAAVRFTLRHRDVAMVAEVLSAGRFSRYTPDLLTPKPSIGPIAGTFARQLEAMAHTPENAVAHQLREAFPAYAELPAEARAAMDNGSFACRAADGLLHFWRAAFAEQWSRLRVTLDADLAAKTSAIGATGIGRAFGSLHPDVSWTGSQLLIDSAYQDTFDLAGEELVLSPSVLSWPNLTLQFCVPSDSVLGYPADGLGVLRQPAGAGLPELMGPSRAAILADLDVARSTSDLSTRRNLSPATVSYHLGVLLRAGLVLRKREKPGR